MKFNSIIIIVLSSLSMMLSSSCFAQKKAQKNADKNTMTWNYEIEATNGQATQGSILVKVWSYSKDSNVALTQAGKNAVHGVMFKGTSAVNDGSTRLVAQKPIVTDPEAETKYDEYLKDFFADGGKYQKYVQFVNNGIPAPGDMFKVGKQYKIGVKVMVAKDALRKELEAAGVVKKLSSGF